MQTSELQQTVNFDEIARSLSDVAKEGQRIIDEQTDGTVEPFGVWQNAEPSMLPVLELGDTACSAITGSYDEEGNTTGFDEDYVKKPPSVQ